MPTATHIPIQTYTISGSSTNSVSFNTISGYTDLVLTLGAKSNHSAGDGIMVRFNGDTSGNYSRTYMYGVGSGNGQGRASNETSIQSTLTQNVWTNTVHHIASYSGSTYKNVLLRNDAQTNAVVFTTGNWRNTNAITSITVSLVNSNYTAGSTITLYGIH